MPKILILANDFGTIYHFRRELLERLQSEKYEIILSLPLDNRNKKLTSLGYQVIESKLERFGKNPLKEIFSIKDYIKLISQVKPDLVLTYTIKPNIYGSIACQRCHVPYLNNVTGLGTIFQTENLFKKAILFIMKLALKDSQCVFFQNESNKLYFEKNRIVRGKTALLPGSGVNLMLYKYEPYPEEKALTRFIIVTRVRKDKGFDELFESIQELAIHEKRISFIIIGGIEEATYRDKLKYMQTHYPVEFLGSKSQEEVRQYIANSHCLLHPSYHEGMANVLLEASATGRPCLASDIPGCKEIIEEGKTGFLFPVKNTPNLVLTLKKFLSLSYQNKAEMGVLARNKIEKEFDRNLVVNAYMTEIERIINMKKEINH